MQHPPNHAMPAHETTETSACAVAVAVVGAGPAGLMAAEVLAAAGVRVDVYDTMPSVGRKFLLAGRGGLNLTHSEPIERFIARYPIGRTAVAGWLTSFGPDATRTWAEGLGIKTFVGSSGRVFPADMKAAPLLRAWLHRLREAGVRVHTRHRWIGWGDAARGSLRFATRAGEVERDARAWILALGGASWPRLGSDGAWVELLAQKGVAVTALRASNCGFDVARPSQVGPGGTQDAPESIAWVAGWSDHFRSRHAGHPVKTVALAVGDAPAGFRRRGEFVVTENGIEGNLVYAASHAIAETIRAHGSAVVHLDLLPDRGHDFVLAELVRPRGSRSLATHLKSRLGIDGVKAALLHELLPRDAFADLAGLARSIKALPLTIAAARPIDEAISSAGGVQLDALTEGLMVRDLPGVFCAGEMLDWDAPTGGYLLTACLASGVAAARGVLQRLKPASDPSPCR